MDTHTAEEFEQAIRRDGRYPPEAYEFLRHGLAHTSRTVHGVEPTEQPQHVSGRQLCYGLRDLALETWGPLAQTVLRTWNIRSTRDFGEMVFLLIGLGLMGKQDSDRLEDFDSVYDFDQAFGSYEIVLEHTRDHEEE